MASFLEKLKKGMSIQEPLDDIEKIEENIKKTTAKKSAIPKEKTPGEKAKTGKKPDKVSAAKEQAPATFSEKEQDGANKQPKKIDMKPILVEVKNHYKIPPVIPEKNHIPAAIEDNLEEKPEETKPAPPRTSIGRENWFAEEGELAVDIYQTEKDLIIQSAVAGINPEDLEIVIEKDMIRIKGLRKNPLEEKGDYFTQECFWGPFKREIILPVEVDSGFAEAIMKEGILTVRLPKILREKKRIIQVKS